MREDKIGIAFRAKEYVALNRRDYIHPTTAVLGEVQPQLLLQSLKGLYFHGSGWVFGDLSFKTPEKSFSSEYDDIADFHKRQIGKICTVIFITQRTTKKTQRAAKEYSHNSVLSQAGGRQIRPFLNGSRDRGRRRAISKPD